jgi:hypothetical protein
MLIILEPIYSLAAVSASPEYKSLVMGYFITLKYNDLKLKGA